MTARSSRHTLSCASLMVAAALLGSIPAGQAATLTWDANGATTGVADGAGNWNTADALWWDGNANASWSNAAADDAVFGNANGAAGSVAIAADITVGNLTFNPTSSGRYTLTGAASTGNTLTLFGAAPVITTNQSATISARVVSTNGFTKEGLGTLTFNGATAGSTTNAIGGTITVNAGQLNFSNNPTFAGDGAFQANLTLNNRGRFSYVGSNYIGNSAVITVGNDAYALFGGTDSIGAFAGSGRIASTSTITLTAGTADFTGVLSGTGALTINGVTQTLSGANLFSGTTTASSGTLRLNHVDALRNSTLSKGNAAVTFNLAGTNTYNLGGLSGATALSIGANTISVGGNNTNNTFSASIGFSTTTGGLTKVGTGTLTLSGASIYTGATTISRGILELQGAGSLATSGIIFNGTGGFTYTGSATGSADSVGALTRSAGHGTITSTYGTSGNTALTFTSVAARTTGATANFVVTTGANGTTNKIILTGQATGYMDQGTFFGGDNFAWYDAGGFVRGLTYGADAGAVTSAGGVSLTASTHHETTAAVTAQADAAFTTLKITGANAFTLAAAQTLTVNGLLKTGTTASLSGGAGLRASLDQDLVIATPASTDALSTDTPVLANGTNALVKTGAGTLTLGSAAVNTHTGGTFINQGTLVVSQTSHFGSTAAVNRIQLNGGTLQLAGSFSPNANHGITVNAGGGTIAGNGFGLTLGSANLLSGAGPLTITGSGSTNTTLTSSAAQNITGPITISSGRLALGAANITNPFGTGDITVGAGSSAIYLNNTGSVWNNRFFITGTGGEGRGILRAQSGGTLNGEIVLTGHASISADGASTTTINGAVSGAFTLTLGGATGANAAARYVLTGNNVHSATTVGLGVTNINHDAALGAYGGTVTINGTATLQAGAAGIILNPERTVALSAATGTHTIDTNGFNMTIQGIVTGAATENFEKTGAGTLSLTGANTYAGVTTLTTGVLNVSSLTDYGVAGPLGQRASASEAVSNIGLRFMGGTLQYTGATAQSTNRQIRIGVGGGAIDASGSVPTATVTFAYSGANTDLFDTAGNRTLTLTGTNTGANTFALGLTDQNATTGKTSLTKAGTGTWVVTGTHTYTGLTTVSAGTLLLGTAGTSNAIAGGGLTIGGANNTLATVQYAGASTDMMGAGTVTINGQGVLDFNGRTDTIGNVAIVSTGATTTNPTPIINTAGGGNLTIGTLGITPAAGLTTIIGSGTGTLTLGGNVTFTAATTGQAQISGRLDMGAAARTFTVALGTGASSDLSVDAVISAAGGAFGLTKAGAGRLTLAGANTFTGGVSISGGTLVIGRPDALPAASTVLISTTTGAGTLRLAADTSVGAWTIGSSSNNSGTIVSDRATAGAGITHVLGLGQFGGNTYSFQSGPNVTSGTAAVSFSSVDLSAGSASTTTLDPTTANVIVVGGVSIATNNLAKTLALGGTGSSNVIQGAVANGLNTLTLTKSGTSTWTLAGANTYTGTTTVSAGTLVYQNTYASPTHSISSGAVLELNVTSGSRSSATTTFNGTGILRKTGGGDIFWGGNGTFALGSGSLIDVRAGSFTGGSGANEVWTNNRSDLNVESGATFNTVEANVRVNKITGTGTIRTGYTGSGYANLTIGVDNGASTFAGVIADASAEGHLVKEGTDVITLSGANTFTGTTTVNAGTLKLSNNLALQSSAFNTASVGTLDLTDAAINNLTLGGLVGDEVAGQNLTLPANVTSLTLNPSAGRARSYLRDISGGAAGLGLTKSGAGTQTLGGTNTYTGVTTLSAGVLNVTALTDYDVAGPLGLRSASAEGSGNVGLRFMGGTLQYTGATAQSTNRQIRIGTAGGSIDASGSVPSATVTFAYSGTNADLFDTGGTRTLTLTGTNTGANTFAIGLTDQAAAKTSLTKTGTGTWVLTGTQTYTGTTTISAGTLNLATSIVSSATTLNGASAVLTGLGTAGNVTLTAGTLRPGDGSATGILNVGALTIAAGQSLGFTLGTPGTSSKVAAASLALPATGAPLRVSLTDNADVGGNGRLAPGTYSLLTYSGSLTGGNATFGRSLTVTSSPLLNKSYSFANTGSANGALNVTIGTQSPVLLQDAFARTGGLGASSPVVAASSASGASWTSAVGITTDVTTRSVGFNTLNRDSATLPFIPQAGNVYTLSASLNATTGTANNWVALGFANSTPPTTSMNNNATLAWMLQRNNNAAGQSFAGGATNNAAAHSSALGGVEQTNTIVLDTRNGLTNATLHFLVNGVAQRTALTGFDASAIANVAIGNYDAGGTIKDLSLTAGSTWLPSVGTNSWNDSANWSAAYRPGSAETIAVFAPYLGTVGQTITLDADQTVGQLAFANSVAGGGSFTINQGLGGSLTLDNSGAGAVIRSSYGNNRVNTPVVLNDTLTVDVATDSSVELSGAIGQTGGARGLTKNGNGILALSGANTYAGPTTVNAGTLRLNDAASTHATSTLTINPGATLEVRAAVTMASLTFAGSTTANIGATGTLARLLTTDTLVTDAVSPVTLNVIGATPGSWTSGTFPLFAYGSMTGAGFQLGTVAGTTSRTLSTTLVNADNRISLTVVNDTPKWTGVVGNDLDPSVGDWLNDTGNWKLATSLETTDFLSGDAVVFDDTATGVTAINVDFPVTPSAVVFDNSAKDYVLDSLTGFGIGGTGSLTKRGSGRLEIHNQNDYSGPTLIEGGTLVLVGTGATLGQASPLTLAGGRLDLGNSSRTMGSLSVTAAGPAGAAVLENGTLTATSYTISNPNGNAIISAGLLESASAGLTKSGAGTATLSGPNTYRGATQISEGVLAVSGAGTLGTGAALSLMGGALDLGGTIQTVGAVTFLTSAGSGETAANGGLRGTSYAASNTAGSLLISANLLANSTAGFAKTGAGAVTLSGNNTFSGPLTLAVNSGVLTLSGDNVGRAAGAQGLTVVNSGATLRLQANAGNTNAGISTALSAEQTAAQPLLLNSGATLQLRADAAVTFSGANSLGGVGGASVTIDVGRLTTAGAGNELTMAPGGFDTWNTTLNITGADGYALRLPAINGSGVGTTTFNPTSANLTLGTLTANAAATMTLGGTSTGNTVSGTIGNGTGTVSLTKSNTSTWTLSGANTYTGATSITAGTLRAGSTSAFAGTSALVMSGTGVLDLNGFNAAFAGNVPTGATTNLITDNAAGTGTTVLTFRQTNNTAVATAMPIMDGSSRRIGIQLANGNGAQQFTNGANTFSGGLTLLGTTDGTRMQIAAAPVSTIVSGVLTAGSFGTGPITVGQAATDKAGIYVTAANSTIANPIVANTGLGTDRVGTFRLDATGLTLSGLLTAGAADFTLSTNGTGSATLSGRITGTNGLRLLSHNSGGTSLTVTLANPAGTNDYNGNTTINDNPQSGRTYTLDLGAADQIPNGSGKGNVVVNTNGTGIGSLRLQGFSETINGLSGSGTVTTTTAGASVLTLGDGDATASFSGTITESVGTLRLVKIGAGTQTLTGLSTYSGGTNVTAGTLTIGVQGNQTATAIGVNKEVTIGPGATLRMTRTDGLGFYGGNPSSLLIRGTITVAAGFHASIGNFGLTLDGGMLTAEGTGTSDGNYIFDGTITSLANANSSVINALSVKLRNGSGVANQSVVFDVADGTAATDLLVSSALNNGNGANGLTKTGNGTLVLAGTNTYSGNTLFGTAVGTSTGVLRLSSSGALGSGKLIINNGNSDTGTVELTGGITVANNIDFFGRGSSGTAAIIRNVSGDNTLGGVLTGSFNGGNYNFHSDAGTLTITNRITTNSSGRTLNLRGAGTIRVTGVIENGTGSMNVRTLDGGNYVLAGANTYTGVTTVSAGRLTVTTLGTTGASSVGASDRSLAGNLVLNGTATLEYAGAGEETSRSFTVSGSGLTLAASGSGALRFGSSAQLALAAGGNGTRELRLGGTNVGDNTFGATLAGTTDEADLIKQLTKNGVGTWIVDGPSNRFRGDLRIDLNEGTLGFTTGALNTSGAGVISVGHGATLRWQAGNTDDISGRILVAAGATAKLDVGSNNVTFASAPTVATGGSLEKQGTGTLRIEATVNAPTLNVAVSSGRLAVNGILGNITLSSGATLGGSGTIGTAIVASGATVAPGNSPGLLTGTSMTLSGGANFEWEVQDATSLSGYDRINLSGALDLTGASPSNKVIFKIISRLGNGDGNTAGNPLNFAPPAGVASIRTFQFGQVGNVLLNDGQNISDVFAFDVSQFTYSDGSASNAALWSINWNSGTGAITLTAVPEPSTYGIGLGALALAAAALRRRRKQTAAA